MDNNSYVPLGIPVNYNFTPQNQSNSQANYPVFTDNRPKSSLKINPIIQESKTAQKSQFATQLQDYTQPDMNCYDYGRSNDTQMIRSQLSPLQEDLKEVKSVLKSVPVFVVCPYCKEQGLTVPKRSINCVNLSCCICFGVFSWVLLQAVNKKDMNCYNAEHYCKKCGNKVGDYATC